MTDYPGAQVLRTMMADTRASFETLLSDEDLYVTDTILGLCPNELNLFSRLYARKYDWIRQNKISYNEINVPETLQKLVEKRLLEPSSLDPEETLSRCTGREIDKMVQDFGLKRASFKAKNIDTIVQQISCPGLRQTKLDPTNLARLLRPKSTLLTVRQLGREFVRIQEQTYATLQRCLLLYSMSSRHEEITFSTMVQNRLGIIEYPSYVVTRPTAIFKTRSQLEDYEQALALEHAASHDLDSFEKTMQAICFNLFELIDPKCKIQLTRSALANVCHGHIYPYLQSSTYFTSRYTKEWVHGRIACLYGKHLERQKRYAEAMDVYARLLEQFQLLVGQRGVWWDRFLTILRNHVRDRSQYRHYLEVSLADSFVKFGHRYALEKRKNPSPAEYDVVMVDLEEHGNVEQLVLEHFAHLGWKGVHSENRFLSTLFGLLFWDILFAEREAVFLTRFQTHPLDLFTLGFYYNRETELRERIREISCLDRAVSLLTRHYNQFHRISCTGVSWDLFSLEELVEILEHIGSESISAMCSILCQDYQSACRGFPDLVLWNGNHQPKVWLLEVKSPTDKLSPHQKHWMETLQQIQSQCGYMFRISVCRARIISKLNVSVNQIGQAKNIVVLDS